MYESAKRATKNYRERLRTKGTTQHSFMSTQQEFNILKTILKVLKNWDLSKVVSLDVDAGKMTITLIQEDSKDENNL